jgi:hypothetical protein
MNAGSAIVIGPNDGKSGSLGGIGARLMIEGAASGGGFSLVEHPMPPHALAAPLHRHTREDEYSYVLEGRMGALRRRRLRESSRSSRRPASSSTSPS